MSVPMLAFVLLLAVGVGLPVAIGGDVLVHWLLNYCLLFLELGLKGKDRILGTVGAALRVNE